LREDQKLWSLHITDKLSKGSNNNTVIVVWRLPCFTGRGRRRVLLAIFQARVIRLLMTLCDIWETGVYTIHGIWNYSSWHQRCIACSKTFYYLTLTEKWRCNNVQKLCRVRIYMYFVVCLFTSNIQWTCFVVVVFCCCILLLFLCWCFVVCLLLFFFIVFDKYFLSV
jgi:hypothetical protein